MLQLSVIMLGGLGYARPLGVSIADGARRTANSLSVAGRTPSLTVAGVDVVAGADWTNLANANWGSSEKQAAMIQPLLRDSISETSRVLRKQLPELGVELMVGIASPITRARPGNGLGLCSDRSLKCVQVGSESGSMTVGMLRLLKPWRWLRGWRSSMPPTTQASPELRYLSREWF